MELVVYIISDFLHILKFLIACDWILMLKKKENKYQKIGIVFLTILFSSLIYYTRRYSADIMILEYLIFVCVFLNYIYNEKIFKICLISVWLLLLVTMFDGMSSVLVDLIFSIINVKYLYLHKILSQLYTLGFVIIVSFLLKQKNGRGIYGIQNRYLVYFTLMTIVDTFVVLALMNVVINNLQTERKFVLVLAFVVIILGIFFQMAMLLILIVSRDIHKEKEMLMEKYLNEQIEHYEYLELREQETRKFRHDIRSHIYVLRSLYKNQEYDKFDEYLEKIDGRIDAFGNKISVNNSIVDAVLNKYLVEAEQKRVHLDVKGHFPTECSISAFDLCTIVSNLLSNAIEAAHRCGGGLVQISFRYNEREIMISVENDYDGVILYEEGVMKTRKDDQNSHGFGLESIGECLKRNGGYMDIQTENFKFKTMLLLKDGNEEVL